MTYTYRDRTTGEYPITPDQIRYRLRQTVSFGPTVDAQTAAQHGFDRVEILDQPAYDDSTHEITADAPTQTDGVWTQGWTVTAIPQAVLDIREQAWRDLACADIDEACAAIYTRVGRFSEEYKSREADALAYHAAGYTGDVPRQVAAFAVPAGVTPTYATNVILAQAAQLRGALAALGELRMRKYEIKTAPKAAAEAALTQILASIAAIGASL